MGRIVFLDHLRGLACILVVFGHVYMMGINDPRTIAVWLPYVQGPIFGVDSPGLNPFNFVTTWLVLEAGISLGSLGVSIFFLISGYIILRTIDRESPVKFAIMRAFRIFPLCAFTSICVAIVTGILCWRYGGESPHSIGSVVANSFAAPGILGTFSTIPVIWSLTVELFFYAAMAIGSACVGRIGLGHIALMSVLSGSFSVASQMPEIRAALSPAVSGAVITFGYCAFHLGFLLIGSALYRCNEAGLFRLRSIFSLMLIVSIYAVTLALTVKFGSLAGTGTTWQIGVLSLVIFLVAMLNGLKLRAIKWFTFFGDISYPLYLIHIPGAWAIMFFLASHGYGMHSATTLAILICIIAAWAMRRAVEIPAHRAGRRVASNL